MEGQITSERWRRVKQIFQAAIELPDQEREAYLADACDGDSSLESEIKSLIVAHQQSGSFMDSPAVDLIAPDSDGDQTQLMVGKSLGRYRILAPLGRGGMGEVYRAKDTTLGREVAIKILPSASSIDRERLRRFEQEARAASALNHPNIITIHEFGQQEGFHFIVSELIEGETLRQQIAREQMMPGHVIEIAIQVTGALNAAHEAGIVHRDIKPENIMVRPDGLVKVLDFGLAKLIEPRPFETIGGDSEATTAFWSGPETGAVVGTVSYMSPEQTRGQKLDARTDLFSLGVTLYEMLTGFSPFARPTTADTIAAILEKEPPPLAEFAPQAPEMLGAIIGKTLRKDRAERYQTAAQLLSDLTGAKTGGANVTLRARKNKSLIGAIRRQSHRWPVAAILLVALVAISALAFYTTGNRRAIKSIAVLPFVNSSENPETEYLADGITENVINSLTQLSNLTVRPRNSVRLYRGKDIDPLAAGRNLKVEAVLTGEVVTHGRDITISLELIDVSENRQLWGAKYSGRINDLLLTEARIAREVTENLQLRLSPVEQQQLEKRYTDNAEAYDLYMKGRYVWNRRDTEGHNQAMEFFEQAIALDPTFALAHAGLADCYVLGGNYRISAQESWSRARASALRALKIDQTLAEAHASLGQVYLFYDWNLAEAEASFKRSIDLKPTYETAHHWYAIMLAVSGRFPAAIDRIKRAQELDPVSRSINKDAGLIYYYSGQYDQAIAECRKTLDLYPDYYAAHIALGEIYLHLGRREEALLEFHKADELAGPRRLIPRVSLGYAHARSGRNGKTLAVLDELLRQSPKRPVSAYYLAVLYTGLGQNDAAFKWLDQALQDRAYRMIYLKIDPVFDSLRSDPRFTDILIRVGLTQ